MGKASGNEWQKVESSNYMLTNSLYPSIYATVGPPVSCFTVPLVLLFI